MMLENRRKFPPRFSHYLFLYNHILFWINKILAKNLTVNCWQHQNHNIVIFQLRTRVPSTLDFNNMLFNNFFNFFLFVVNLISLELLLCNPQSRLYDRKEEVLKQCIYDQILTFCFYIASRSLFTQCTFQTTVTYIVNP